MIGALTLHPGLDNIEGMDDQGGHGSGRETSHCLDGGPGKASARIARIRHRDVWLWTLLHHYRTGAIVNA